MKTSQVAGLIPGGFGDIKTAFAAFSLAHDDPGVFDA